MLVKDIMSEKVHTVSPEINVWQASNKLRTLHVGCMVVIEDGAICGILSERDIVYKIISPKLNAEKTKVRQIMTSPVITVKPDTTVNDVLFIASTRHLRHMPVVNDKGELIGILGIRDLIYQALNLLLADNDYLNVNNKKAAG